MRGTFTTSYMAPNRRKIIKRLRLKVIKNNVQSTQPHRTIQILKIYDKYGIDKFNQLWRIKTAYNQQGTKRPNRQILYRVSKP